MADKDPKKRDKLVDEKFVETWVNWRAWLQAHNQQDGGFADFLKELEVEYESYPRGPAEHDIWFDFVLKGQLKTRWIYEDDTWRIHRLVFSRTR